MHGYESRYRRIISKGLPKSKQKLIREIVFEILAGNDMLCKIGSELVHSQR